MSAAKCDVSSNAVKENLAEPTSALHSPELKSDGNVCDSDSSNFFETLKRYPSAVPDSDGNCSNGKEWDDYDIVEVLDASSDFLPFFDKFGSLLKICKNDFEGNIVKLRKRKEMYPEAKTFAQLIKLEISRKETKQKDSASIALLWYTRGLGFILAFLANTMEMECESMTAVFDKAYAETLKRYHNWIVQKAIVVVAKMLPYRVDVLQKFGWTPETGEKCMKDLRDYHRNMAAVKSSLSLMLIDMGLDPDFTEADREMNLALSKLSVSDPQ